MQLFLALVIVIVVFVAGAYIGRHKSTVENGAVVLAVTRRVRAELEGRAVLIETTDRRSATLFSEDLVRTVLDRIDAEVTEHLS